VIQFEEIIMEESINICEQLSSSYEIKEGGNISLRGKSPTKDSFDFDSIKPLKRAIVPIRPILLIITALIIYSFFTTDSMSVSVLKGFDDTYRNFKSMFLDPYPHGFTLLDVFFVFMMIVRLIFMTTLFCGIIALFLGLLDPRLRFRNKLSIKI